MKSRLEACDQSWEEYWARQLEPPWWKDDHRLYQDIDEMLSALPDIGGLRICVYTPEDVDKVVDYLIGLYKPGGTDKTAENFDRTDLLEEPPQIIRRGHGPDHVHDLKHHIESLEEKGNMHISTTEDKLHYRDQFPGYRATHVRVRVRPDLMYDEIHLDGHHTLEIQIMTVIMDAWAQVVHGLTYKPDLPPPDSLRILLDQLGGIVSLGEGTLTQVSRVQADLQDSRARSQGATPDDWYELGAWLSKACKVLEPESFSIPSSASSKPKFEKLDELLKVLIVTDEHTYGHLQQLLKKAHEDHGRKILTYDLPVHLLRTLAEKREADPPVYHAVSTKENEDDEQIFLLQTRQKAQKVVNIINMAGFLDIGDDFVHYTCRAMKKLAPTAPENSQSKTPSTIEMLDLLHHEKPQVRDVSSMRKIQDFCRAFCKESRLADVVDDEKLLAVLELPRMLVNAGYVARPIFDDPSEIFPRAKTTVIPRDLCAFLEDVGDTHFIPEILNVAQKITERESKEDAAPDQEPAAVSNVVFTGTANWTRWLSSRRMRFEPKDEEKDFFRVLVDRMEVPMRSRFDQTEGTMVLEIDKHKEKIWPHPGFFSTTVCRRRDHDHGKLPRWKYIESKANDWSIGKLQDETVSLEVNDKGPVENNFLRLFKRLHPDCAPIESDGNDQETKDYRFRIKNKRFCVSSTPEKYILKEDTKHRND